MANIDVSELMTDPDFVDPVTVVARTFVVDTLGQNQLTESCEPSYGSVQPASGKTMQRLPDALRVANVMSFWVNNDIRAKHSKEYPVVLVFEGTRFAVQTIFPWTNWGQGYCEGTCVAEAPTG